MFERLESRTLLTMVYDFEPLPAVDLDIGSIAYLEAPHIEVDGDLIARSSLGLARVNDQGVFQFGQEVVSTQPFYAYGGNYYGTGRLREDLFDPGDSTPPHGVIVVGEDGAAKGWYGDVSSPAAEVIASGSLPDGRYRVIVEYSDEFRLGNESLDVAPTLETPSGTTLSLSATRLVGDAPHRPDITTVVRYAYDFNAPGGSWNASDNGVYVFTIPEGAVVDSVGNTNAFETVWFVGISCPASGLDSSGAPWRPAAIVAPPSLEMIPSNTWRNSYSAFRGFLPYLTGVSRGRVIALESDASSYTIVNFAHGSEPTYQTLALEATIDRTWGAFDGGFIAYVRPRSFPSSESSVIHIDTDGKVTTILDSSLFPGSGYGSISTNIDGSVVVWFGEPTEKGAARAATHRASGFFAAVDVGGYWRHLRVAGDSGNGYIEAGESFTDINRNGTFDQGAEVAASPYGSGFEDYGPITSEYGVHVSDRDHITGAFKVLFSSSIMPELWVVSVGHDSSQVGGFAVSAPDAVLENQWSPLFDTDDIDEYFSVWWSEEPLKEISVSDRSINAAGEIAFVAQTMYGQNYVVRAKPAGLRPVLYVPGIMGSFPKTENTLLWLLRRGAPPEWLEIDPLAKGYADILKTLENHGYTPDVDLISAVYDWRMPPGPAPIRDGGIGEVDGFVDGITASSISDRVFEYGVDYLGHWLKHARALWASRHPSVPLNSVDIIAHSTGGLVTRTYIQSEAYLYAEQAGLPRINEFIMIGVPNRGASKAWNVVHDNWIGDPVYMAAFATIMEAARDKMVELGVEIRGPGGSSITPAMVAAHAKRLDPVDPNEYEAFIDLYCPTIRSLLATYPMLDIDQDGVPELAVGSAGSVYPLDVPNPLLERNEWVLDLNNGLDLNYTSWAFMDLITNPGQDPNRFGGHRASGLTGTTVIYGESDETLSFASMRRGALDEASILQVFGMADEFPHPAGFSERWYRDRTHDLGDLTVPRQSSRDQFLGDPRFRVRGFSRDASRSSGEGVTKMTTGPTDHVGLNSNADVQRLVLETLGIASRSGGISTTLAGTAYWSVGSLLVSLLADPIQTYIVDGLGRRLGWTEATGALAEIPGSIYRGGADGFGFFAGELVEPVRFVTIGLGGEHFSKVKLTRGDQTVGAESRGLLAAGQQRVQTITPPSPVNTHDADRVLRALVDAVPSVSVGPGGAITIGMVNAYGQTTLFKRNAADAGWNAREPDPLGAAGSPSSDAVSWRDTKDGKFYAAVPTDQGLLLFREAAAGEWTVRNLTSEISSAGLITSKITQWKTNATRNNVFRIVGTLENGDVVQYEQTVAQGPNGYLWNFKNLSDDLRKIGQATPRFDGRLVAYTTAWDAWHIAGLDAEGQIQTIWRGPKMSQWVLSNLSTITGAPVLSGGLTVYLTPWKGINLAGVDETGQLQVTWWVPKFIGAWVVSNLSSSISAPAIDGASIVSFNTPAGGLNMAARTTDDELVVFWWVPGAPGNKWRVQGVSSAVPTGVVPIVPEGELAATASGDGLTSIVGRGAHGEVVRFFGSVIDQAWNFESISEIAALQ